MTWRRLGVLIKGLPATSRLQTKLRDTVEFDEPAEDEPVQFGPWSAANHQLATLIDAVRDLTVVVASANGAHVDPLPRVPRPELKIRGRVDARAAVLARLEQIRIENRRGIE